MEIPQKLQKALASSTWYHGTTLAGYQSLCEKGVIADFNAGSELDFGYGFYLSPTAASAESYISRLPVQQCGYDPLVIIEYQLDPLAWFKSEEYNTLWLPKFNNTFAEFVLANRMDPMSPKPHNYDAIYGVMSDSVPTILIRDYRAKLVTREETILKLQKSTSMKQLSIHSQELCDTLRLTRAYIFDPTTNERKELCNHVS